MAIPVDNGHPGDYGSHIKELTPGITQSKEKASFPTLDSHKSQLKNEELFYRVQQR